MFEIDKGVAIPKRRGGGRKAIDRYPFSGMAVGDSFLIPWEDDAMCYAGVRGGIYRTAKRVGVQVVVRKQREGVRVWRVS